MSENSNEPKILNLVEFLNNHKKTGASKITVDKIIGVYPEVDQRPWYDKQVQEKAAEIRRMKFLEDQLKQLRMEMQAAEQLNNGRRHYKSSGGQKRKNK